MTSEDTGDVVEEEVIRERPLLLDTLCHLTEQFLVARPIKLQQHHHVTQQRV